MEDIESRQREILYDAADETSFGWFEVNMHKLAAEGNTRGIELLTQRGVSLEVKDSFGYTPLHMAAQTCQLNVVKRLIEVGADVHAKTAFLQTPVHLVAKYGRGPISLEILTALLNHGASTHDLRINIGEGRNGKDELDGEGCDRDGEGDTLLHCAAYNCNPEILQELLRRATSLTSSADACLALQNKKGRTPLHNAAGTGNIEAASLLLNAGARKDARDKKGWTPFHLAARCGNTKLLEMLQLEVGVDDPECKTQIRALHFAAWNGHNEAVKWLLDHGADHRASLDNITDAELEEGDMGAARSGDTPLHLAGRRGNAQVVETLIEGGADAQVANKEGEIAIGLADENEHGDVVRTFIRIIRERNQEEIKVSLSRNHRNNDVTGLLSTTHGKNGATLLHYVGAYGTGNDIQWILELIKSQEAALARGGVDNSASIGRVNIRDKCGRSVVHWAAMKGNKDVVKSFAENELVDLNVTSDGYFRATPLAVAIINEKTEFAEELLKWMPKYSDAESWLSDVRLDLCYDQKLKRDPNFQKKLESLQAGYKQHSTSNTHFLSGMPTAYLALYADREDIARFIQKHRRGVEDAVNERGKESERTALHWATLLRQRRIVAQLCRTEVFAQELTANEEDALGKTALQYAKQMGFKEIEKELMQRSDVNAYMESMYKDRQVYVDATNAILVGAAFIAGVTFAGWIQPPLNYTPYYNLPQLPPPSPPDIFQTYAAIQQHLGVRFFWVFNSLSFSFAIATMLAALVGVVPIPGIYIATSVLHLRRCLLIAAAFLGLSIVFVLAAFAAAGFAVLPPLFEYQAYMMATVIVGGIPCLVLLAWFAYRLCQELFLRDIKTKFLSNREPWDD